MNSYWSSLAADVGPGVTLVLVGFLAGMPPYVLLRQAGRGRARSAISYLCGLAVGIVATALLVAVLLVTVDIDATMQAGLFASFFCPFIGMARAKWDGPRKRTRRTSMTGAVTQ